MKLLIKTMVITMLLIACKSGQKSGNKQLGNVREAKVLEVLESGGYTYLRAEENGKEVWLAASQIPAQVGETYYFEGGLTMTNFKSETMSRTFESIIFLDKISKDINDFKKDDSAKDPQEFLAQHHKSGLTASKQDIKVDPAKGGITIFELYNNRKKYKGEKVIIRGIVTKFNEAIMSTNWIHIQDGSGNDEDFDLTANSKSVVKVGDTITLEGKITLDIDLGHGYQYKILMEEAEIK